MKHLKTTKQFSEKINESEQNKVIRGDNFHLDLADFEKISRDVGFFNCMSNMKDDNDDIDLEITSKYEKLREKQLIMFEEMLKFYSK
jgi:hypothetical protein